MKNSSDYEKDTKRKLRKESALDPYRIARRLTSVLGWTFDFTNDYWCDRDDLPIRTNAVLPMVMLALKVEIDSNRLLGPEGYAARIGRDIHPTEVLDSMLAIAHNEVRANG